VKLQVDTHTDITVCVRLPIDFELHLSDIIVPVPALHFFVLSFACFEFLVFYFRKQPPVRGSALQWYVDISRISVLQHTCLLQCVQLCCSALQ